MNIDPEILDRHRTVQKIKASMALADRASCFSMGAYLRNVLIDTGLGPRRYRDVAEPWQWDIARTLVPPAERIAGVDTSHRGPMNVWLTLGRGHDKTSLIGRTVSWLLAYSRKPLSMVAAAADKDQAALIADFMDRETALNPWLRSRLKFKNYRVEGNEGRNALRIISADAYSSFGLKCDVYVLDEVTHWKDDGLYNALLSGQGKRQGNELYLVITNAGYKATWQWDKICSYRSDRYWGVYEAPGVLASWMKTPAVESVRRSLPPAMVRRVYDNEWIDPGEDNGLVSRAEARGCSLLADRMGLRPSDSRPSGSDRRYVASIDYGPKKDRTVACVGHLQGDVVCVDHMTVWEGKNFPSGRVPVELVEQWISRTERAFGHPHFVIDKHEMESVVQKFEGVYDVKRFEARGGKSNYEMAQTLRALIVNGRMAWPKDLGAVIARDPETGRDKVHTLEDEFCELIVKPTSYGFRFDHTAGRHDDRVVAVGQMAVCLTGERRNVPFPSGDLWF